MKEGKENNHLSDYEKINIILEEYKTLRTEVTERNGILIRVFTVAATLIVGTIGLMVQASAYIAGSIVIFLGALLIAFTWFVVDQSARKCSYRLQEIEQAINELAKERLLCWESRFGLPATGYKSWWGLAPLKKD